MFIFKASHLLIPLGVSFSASHRLVPPRTSPERSSICEDKTSQGQPGLGITHASNLAKSLRDDLTPILPAWKSGFLRATLSSCIRLWLYRYSPRTSRSAHVQHKPMGERTSYSISPPYSKVSLVDAMMLDNTKLLASTLRPGYD
jgi:hypothetical protein